jgi:hypothetical protein
MTRVQLPRTLHTPLGFLIAAHCHERVIARSQRHEIIGIDLQGSLEGVQGLDRVVRMEVRLSEGSPVHHMARFQSCSSGIRSHGLLQTATADGYTPFHMMLCGSSTRQRQGAFVYGDGLVLSLQQV